MSHLKELYFDVRVRVCVCAYVHDCVLVYASARGGQEKTSDSFVAGVMCNHKLPDTGAGD